MSHNHDEALGSREELLAGLALGDLSHEERAALGSVNNQSDRNTLEQLQFTIAALDLAMNSHSQDELPSALRERVLEQGRHMVAGQRSHETPKTRNALPEIYDYERIHREADRGLGASRTSIREVLAWCVCAAAILLAVGLWQFNQPAPNRALTTAQARSKLIAESIDLLQVAWSNGKTPFFAQVTGDVVWSSEKQLGFMRFVNLPPNDPMKEQYQLWIIDPARDDEPIDGGVFDVVASGETIIPIEAKLKVLKPAAFAITIEKPGGVVVSTQERLPLLATVKEG